MRNAVVKSVALVRGDDRRQNVRRALELIQDDLAPLRSKKNILIKPNLTATRVVHANTHADCIRGLLDFCAAYLDDFPEKTFTVMEGSGSAYYERCSTHDVFATFGYRELAREYPNLKLIALEDCHEFVEIEVRSIAGGERVGLAAIVRDFDYRISLNLPKTHNYAIATLGIKNMMGLLRQRDKSMIHGLRTPSAPRPPSLFSRIPTAWIARMRRRAPWVVNALLRHSVAYLEAVRVIHRNVVSVTRHTWPDLVVIDAWEGMEGDGPVDGERVELRAAVASADALKADGVGARLMGFDPGEIGYLYYLHREGWGDYSLEGLRGEPVSSVARQFKRHPTYAVQKLWEDTREGVRI
jgi:uncharacterized protein (DUF362 family)